MLLSSPQGQGRTWFEFMLCDEATALAYRKSTLSIERAGEIEKIFLQQWREEKMKHSQIAFSQSCLYPIYELICYKSPSRKMFFFYRFTEWAHVIAFLPFSCPLQLTTHSTYTLLSYIQFGQIATHPVQHYQDRRWIDRSMQCPTYTHTRFLTPNLCAGLGRWNHYCHAAMISPLFFPKVKVLYQ